MTSRAAGSARSGATTRIVLFTDLRGSTEHRIRLGDDAFDVLRREHDRMMATAVSEHGGEIVKSTGDGLMAAFPSASDAVSCAAAMQHATSRLSRGGKTIEPLTIGIGVAAGDIVAESGDLHGTAVIEAARLCATARGGRVIVSDVVRLLVGRRGTHQFVPLGEIELKGFAAPVVAHEVLWLAALATSLPLPTGLARGRLDYAGRDAVRELLVGMFTQTVAGERRVVFVSGEPGIGKTRLATEIAITVHDQGAIVLAGACDEVLGGPFQPWVDVLTHLIAHLSDEALAAHVAAHDGELTRIVPDLARRCPGVATTSPDRHLERHQLFEAVSGLLATTARETPVVLVLDDLQWADTGSLQLLRHLARLEPPAPMLLIGIYRDDALDHAHPLARTLADLRRDHLFEHVALQGLTEAETADVLSLWAGGSPPTSFVRAMVAETEGNPFFVGEVLAHLVELGTIVPGGGQWPQHVPFDRMSVPDGVREMIARRLSRLSKRAIKAIEVASVIGRQFDLATIAAAGGGDVEDLIEAMDATVRVGLTVEDALQPGRYSFAHALTRQTVYAGLGLTRRTRLHWRVGEALRHSSRGDIDAVAYHLAEGVLAGDTNTAIDAALSAGASALDTAAFETAIDQFTRAISILDVTGTDDDDRRYDALMGRGHACIALSDLGGYTAAFLAAASIARSERSAARLARAALGAGAHLHVVRIAPEAAALFDEALEAIGPDDSVERSLLLSHRAYHRSLTPGVAEDPEAAIVEAAAIADRCGDRSAAAYATFVLASQLRGTARAPEMAARSIELLHAARDLDDVVLLTHAYLLGGTARLQLGDRTAWDVAAQEMAELAQRPSATFASAQARLWEIVAMIFDERYAEARAAATSAAAATPNLPVLQIAFRSQAIILDQWFGDQGDSIATLRDWEQLPGLHVSSSLLIALNTIAADPTAMRAAAEALASVDFEVIVRQAAQRPWILDSLAELCARSRTVRYAHSIERLLIPYAGQLLVGPSALCVHHAADVALARLAALQGRDDDADRLFMSGLALEERVGARMIAMTSRLWYAEHLANCDRGESDRALGLVQTCVDTFERSGHYLAGPASDLRSSLTRGATARR